MEPVIDQAFAAALYSDGDDGLDTGASLLAADPASDAELLRRGEEFVRRAWGRGWLPADLVRIVRRELDEHAAGLAAGLIGSEVRRYETLPPRWQGQLDELPAAPPHGAAGPFLVLLRSPGALPAAAPAARDRTRRAPARRLARHPASAARARRAAHADPDPGAAGQGRGDRISRRGRGAHHQGAGADGPAQHRRGPAGGPYAQRQRAGRLPDRGGRPVRDGQGDPARRRRLGEPLPGRVERRPRLLDRDRIRAGPGGRGAAPHLSAGAGHGGDDPGRSGPAGRLAGSGPRPSGSPS